MGRIRHNLEGLVFNYLTALKYSHLKGTQSYWICRCECGIVKTIRTSQLKEGTIKSCGCKRLKLIGDAGRLDMYEASFNQLYNHFVASSRRRKYKFCLSKDQVKRLTKQKCYYCKSKPSMNLKNKALYGDYIYNGIDRVDNSKGYVIKNCVPCCRKCNCDKKSTSMHMARKMIEHANRLKCK